MSEIGKSAREIAGDLIRTCPAYELEGQIALALEQFACRAIAAQMRHEPSAEPPKLDHVAAAIRAEFDKRDGTPERAARAAIEALKHPSRAQMLAVAAAPHTGIHEIARGHYSAMLDAVLAEPAHAEPNAKICDGVGAPYGLHVIGDIWDRDRVGGRITGCIFCRRTVKEIKGDEAP